MATHSHTTIHINAAPTMGTAAGSGDTKKASKTKTSTPIDESESVLKNAQILSAPATLLPPEVLEKKANSTKTTSNAAKPVITTVGPMAVSEKCLLDINIEDHIVTSGDSDSDIESEGKKFQKNRHSSKSRRKKSNKIAKMKTEEEDNDSSENDTTSSTSEEDKGKKVQPPLHSLHFSNKPLCTPTFLPRKPRKENTPTSSQNATKPPKSRRKKQPCNPGPQSLKTATSILDTISTALASVLKPATSSGI